MLYAQREWGFLESQGPPTGSLSGQVQSCGLYWGSVAPWWFLWSQWEGSHSPSSLQATGSLLIDHAMSWVSPGHLDLRGDLEFVAKCCGSRATRSGRFVGG
jgi:hypothetical protein